MSKTKNAVPDTRDLAMVRLYTTTKGKNGETGAIGWNQSDQYVARITPSKADKERGIAVFKAGPWDRLQDAYTWLNHALGLVRKVKAE